MGRPRSFDQREVVGLASGLFERLGYEATSVDDLVTGVGLHRGSLYKAFGSKRGLFVTALRDAVEALPERLQGDLVGTATLDLVLVAAMELAHRDTEVADLVRTARDLLDARPPHAPCGAADLLGRRLLHRALNP
jgi:TetR/AcrR family transcriptional regulator, transcriptional repressor for nem operon